MPHVSPLLRDVGLCRHASSLYGFSENATPEL